MPPDISMCADDECPSRAKCYRSKASGTVPSEYQQAFTDFEREPEDERCGDFWPVLHTNRNFVVQSERDKSHD
jgi:hypothetical protein